MRSKVLGSGFVRLDNHLTLKTGLVPFSLSSSCVTRKKNCEEKNGLVKSNGRDAHSKMGLLVVFLSKDGSKILPERISCFEAFTSQL